VLASRLLREPVSFVAEDAELTARLFNLSGRWRTAWLGSRPIVLQRVAGSFVEARFEKPQVRDV
jgi:hypothetical protein